MNPQAQEQLNQLEAAVTQFFGAAIDSVVKQQIEVALTSLKNQPQSYLVAQQCLVYSQNSLVHFFAVQVFEEWATRRWESLPDEQKLSVRATLLQFYTERQATLAPFVSNKIAKVLSDIAKRDWPQRWPDFLPLVMQLASAEQTSLAGVLVLRAVLEEFTSNKEDVPTNRKAELRRLLVAEAPTLRDVLTRIMAGQLARQDVAGAAAADARQEPVMKEAIEALYSFFAWAPMEVILHAPLFSMLLRLVAQDNQLSLRALSCINEVMAKTFVPAQFEPFLLDIFQQIFALLGNLTKGGSLLGETSPYIEKLIEFTQLFVTHHFARAETSNRFPILEFLGLLYRFTFMQPRLQGFLECLQIWDSLIEFLRGSSAQQRQRYFDGLSSLAEEILRRIQFSQNAAQLAQLSTHRTVVSDLALHTDESHHEQPVEQSELGSFVAHCVELLGLLTELYPTLLAKLHELINQRTAQYVSDMVGASNTLPDSFRVFDVETMLSLLGRLAEFSTLRFQDSFMSTHVLLRRTVEIAVLVASRHVLSKAPSSNLFQELATQAFGTLRAFSPWVSMYQSATETNQPAKEELSATFTPLLDLIARCADASLPESFSAAAFQLLNSLVVTVKLSQPRLFTLPSINALFNSLTNVAPNLSPKLHSVLYVALSNAILVLPPQPSVDPTNMYVNFLETLVGPLRVAAQSQAPNTAALLARVVAVLSAILQAVQDIGGRTAKPIVYMALKDTLGLILPFVRHSVSAAMAAMDFFSAVFQVLPAQIGAPNVQLVTAEILAAINEPLSQLGRAIQAAPATPQTAEVIQLVVKFLSLLRYIAESSVAAFESFIPSILSICVDRILPLVSTTPQTEMHSSLLRLCASLVMQHPKLFFGNDETSIKIFSAVLEVFLAALGEKGELAVVTVALELLNTLHEKQSLFQRLLFMANYRVRYVSALFAILFGRSHELLRDEIVRTLYNIVSCDFDAFYSQLLPGILERLAIAPQLKATLAEYFKGATDAPSFAQAVFAVLNDYAYVSTRM